MTKSFIKVGYIGLAVVLFLFILQLAYFLTAKEFNNTLLDFQFAKNSGEVLNLFYEGGFDHQAVQAVNVANIADFLFFAAYSLFILALLYKMYERSGLKMLYYALPLPLVIFVADLSENIQQFIITANLVEGDFESNVGYLRFFTYLKWISLALTALGFARFYYWRADILSNIFAGISVLPVIFAFAALVSDSGWTEKIMAGSIFFALGLAIAYCFIYEDKSRN